MSYRRPAVVVGICIHGLATVRALAKAGIRVYVLEKEKSRPGTVSKYADSVIIADTNGVGLVNSLKELGRQFGADEKPVLILTNDDMVRVVAQHWLELEPYYLLSWSDSIELVLRLQLKSEIEAFCAKQGLHYPKSWNIDTTASAGQIKHDDYPVIIKPFKPLSSFKTLIARSAGQLAECAERYEQDLPFLAQHWIPGTDESIYFCALYLEKGEVLTYFVGQKLLSHPPAQGQTLVAVDQHNLQVYELAKQFFSGLNLSGPVSLELKGDGNGRYWVIEPTVGRTDFWLDLSIQCGVNLPVFEYCSVLDLPRPDLNFQPDKIWFDSERDIFSYSRLVLSQKKFHPFSRHPVFPYWGYGDPRPYFAAVVSNILKIIKSRLFRGTTSAA